MPTNITTILRDIPSASDTSDKQAQVISFLNVGLAFAGVVVAILTLRAMRNHTDLENQIYPDVELGKYKPKRLRYLKLIKLYSEIPVEEPEPTRKSGAVAGGPIN
jgi:hypothetical protein